MNAPEVLHLPGYDLILRRIGRPWLLSAVVAGTVFLLCSSTVPVGSTLDAAEQAGNHGETEEEDRKPVNWRPLFSGRVAKVRIVLFDNESVPHHRGLVGDEEFVFETRDPETLAILNQCLFRPLRVAWPDEKSFAAAGAIHALGKMVVTIEERRDPHPGMEDEFVVGITSGGFTLGSTAYRIQNAFFTWGVAKLLDDVLVEKLGRHLPEDVFQHLSGDARIAAQKEAYESLRKAYAEKEKAGPPDRAAAQAQRPAGDKGRPERKRSDHVDWSLLVTTGAPVTKVRMVLYGEEELALPQNARDLGTTGLVGDQRFVFSTRDPETLAIMTQGLHMPLRIACPVGSEAVGFYYTLGKLIVTTEDSKFVVGITTASFALEANFFSIQNAFFSWGVAKLLDDVLFEKLGRHLPKDLFPYLSGEAWKRRVGYEYVRELYSKKKGDGLPEGSEPK